MLKTLIIRQFKFFLTHLGLVAFDTKSLLTGRGVQSMDAFACVESICCSLKGSGHLDHALGDSINGRVCGLTNLRQLWLT